MQRRTPLFIGDLIRKGFASSETLQKGMRESDIVNSWNDIVGEQLALSTTRMYIREQRLYVEFSSVMARKEFYNRRYEILNHINQIAGSDVIKFISVL